MPYQVALVAAASLAAHWGYFNHGEHDLRAPAIAKVHIATYVGIASAKAFLTPMNWSQAFGETSFLLAVYFVVMMASIGYYRIYVSPLKDIPGLLSWRLSKLTHVVSMTKPDNFLVLEGLRKRFGDVVRTGPNEVTIFTVEAFQQVYNSPGKHFNKSPYYDLLQPMESLDTTRDPAMHARRRKVWDQFFSVRSLEKQESLIYEYGDRLVNAINKRLSQPLDVSDWFERYTFDLMGKFGLGYDFGLLEGQVHDIHEWYHHAHGNLGPISAAPWIKHLMMSIPYIERLKSYRLFLTWTNNVLKNKIASKEEQNDVLAYVIDDARKNEGYEEAWRFMLGDLALLIAAGSDPMRLTLANVFYYLISYPSQLDKVRQELSNLDVRDYRSLSNAEHLSAVIYEVLRLHPAVPAAGLRIAPPEGMLLRDSGDLYIPGGTTVLVPHYSLHRDPRNFSKPDDFIPERFTTKPELILNADAYQPWSAGKGQCIGKKLSLLEIRVAIALLVQRFDISFAKPNEASKVFDEAVDYFTVTPGPLELVFKERHIY